MTVPRHTVISSSSPCVLMLSLSLVNSSVGIRGKILTMGLMTWRTCPAKAATSGYPIGGRIQAGQSLSLALTAFGRGRRLTPG